MYDQKRMAPPIPRAEILDWAAEIRQMEAIIANVRTLLTTGPGSEARAGNDPGLIDVADGSVADGAEVADEEWRAAIRKALGE